jgi:hypothetical protein
MDQARPAEGISPLEYIPVGESRSGTLRMARTRREIGKSSLSVMFVMNVSLKWSCFGVRE